MKAQKLFDDDDDDASAQHPWILFVWNLSNQFVQSRFVWPAMDHQSSIYKCLLSNGKYLTFIVYQLGHDTV